MTLHAQNQNNPLEHRFVGCANDSFDVIEQISTQTGRRKEKRKLAETPSMLDPSQLAAKKQQPSEDMNAKATSPAIVISEEANSGRRSEGNLPENAACDTTRGEQNATPTPKVRTTPKNMRKKPKSPKTVLSGKGS